MNVKVINTLYAMWIIGIVIFVTNFNGDLKHLWNLGYYMTYDILVFIATVLTWILYNNTFTRSLVIAVWVYYLYHFGIQSIEIFNEPLKEELFTGKIIKYILGLSCGCSILVLPLLEWIKRRQVVLKLKICLKNLLR